MVALFGFLVMVFGQIKRVKHETDIQEKPAVDPTALAADLARLRKNLGPQNERAKYSPFCPMRNSFALARGLHDRNWRNGAIRLAE